MPSRGVDGYAFTTGRKWIRRKENAETATDQSLWLSRRLAFAHAGTVLRSGFRFFLFLFASLFDQDHQTENFGVLEPVLLPFLARPFPHLLLHVPVTYLALVLSQGGDFCFHRGADVDEGVGFFSAVDKD